ncbi:outer membrane protein assembly factor BamB family protein [Anaeromyxobacter oryzae]|uniref:Serine/threonine protein kinase n=1 Tax=Anaeromyxobacter oryzae TaxID=2918170 RepID=A0ABN6N3D2_9BACT|nr:PQQ-binding-like beta-propeller repeat protein [Anaeromyxobacter oryzae]BDG06517.1 serine/threonine protein kinase [Anaeromyxobacter oryzae]
MTGAALALALAAAPTGLSARLPPAPLALYSVAWERPIAPIQPLEAAPLEAGGAVVDPATGIVVFGTRDGWLHALRKDGTVAWELRGNGAFNGPPAIEGDTVYAGASDGRLYAIAIATGKERWRYEAKEELATRPAIVEGTVFVMSLQDTLFAVDARTGAWKWHHRREPRAGFSIRGAAGAAVRAGVAYAGYSDGWVAAVDASNGRVIWEKPVAPQGDYLDVDGLQVEDGRVFVAAYSGAVLALDAKTGDTVWTFRTPGAARVAVRGGLVVAVTVSSVVGLARDNGARLWATPLHGAPTAPPLFAGSWIVVPAGTGGLRFLEPASGRTLRVFDPGSGVSSAPGVLGSRMYVLSNAGGLFALDLS